MEKVSKIFLAGHSGLAGSALLRKLRKEGYQNIIFASRKELDLCRQSDVLSFFEFHKPEYVFLVAARVGGILANQKLPAEFIYQNLVIQANVIHAAFLNGVKRLIFFASSCCYPREVSQPFREDQLFTNALEPTNHAYAVAKLAGIEMCRSYNSQYGTNFLSIILPNLYGPGDNYDPVNSHVIGGLIRRFHEAKKARSEKVVIWGSGRARREFMYSEDMADVCLFLMNLNDEQFSCLVRPQSPSLGVVFPVVNVGVGFDISIAELAYLVAEIVSFGGDIIFDASRPDGMPQKIMDNSRLMKLGASVKWTTLKDGLFCAYQDFLSRFSGE